MISFIVDSKARCGSVLAGALFGIACAVLAHAQTTPAPSGRLIDLGGYRIHLNCTGRGRPVVLLSSGGGDFSLAWTLVQEKVSAFSRVCSYDRPGSAWSDPGPQPRTLRQEAYELHTALERSGERGPFVLVGHSLGGLAARIFGSRYPAETAGIVLVDATSEDTVLGLNDKLVRMREMAKDRPIPEIQTMSSSPPQPATPQQLQAFAERRQRMGETTIQAPFDKLPARIQQLQLWANGLPPRSAFADNYFAEELQLLYSDTKKNPQPFGDKPLITIIGARHEAAPAGVAPEQWVQLQAEKMEQKRAFAALSRNSKVIFDNNAGHHVHLDDPATVVEAIRAVRTAARKHTKLP